MGSIEGKTRLVPEMNVSQYVKDWNWAKRGYPSLKLIYPGSTRFSDTLSFTEKDKCKVKVPEKLQWRDVVALALSETSSRQSELFEDV